MCEGTLEDYHHKILEVHGFYVVMTGIQETSTRFVINNVPNLLSEVVLWLGCVLCKQRKQIAHHVKLELSSPRLIEMVCKNHLQQNKRPELLQEGANFFIYNKTLKF